jgi:DeoR/GlpR family transcriptional regulator of sugar metabolism
VAVASTLRGTGDSTPTHGAPELRREAVRRRVAELGFVRVDQLARECGVSLMTMHRDLDELEGRGFLRKVRGGRFVPAYDSFLGQATAAAAADLQADVLVMSTTAVTDGVCYIQSQDTVVTRRALIASAARTVVMVDHTKFARRALHRLVDLATLDRVVVDESTAPAVVQGLRRRAVRVDVVPLL